MLAVSLNNITKCYGSNKVIENVSFDVKEKEKVALIGTNGCGKSTILKMIAGIENLTSGIISLKKGIRIGILNQAPPCYDENKKVKDVFYDGLKRIFELKNKMDYLEEKLNNCNEEELEKVINDYTKVQEKFMNAGGYEIDSKIGKVTKVFKISSELLERNFNSLSGGEKTIVLLASLILEEPDVLLLDEPTNHLDISTLEWLENYLSNYNGTILVVSHDRYFLDKVVSKVILVERENVEVYYGNYSHYLKEKEERIMLEFKDYKNQQKQIEAMKKSILKLREFGNLAKNEMFFKRANSIEKRLDKMEKLDKPLEKKKLPISFDFNDRSGKVVLDIRLLNMSFQKKLFYRANATIFFGERVCLMGPNGSGKSTLVKEVLKNNNPSIKLGSSLKIGYIPQEIKFDNENLTIIEEARRFFIGEEYKLRASLDKFNFFGDNIYKKIKVLSGGEKVRLKLYTLMQDNYNFLILDEITNHIDIDTKEVLEEALREFKGTILFISHDRFFINNLATRIIRIENNKLNSYIGNYDDYLKLKEKQYMV